ncbi:MAG: PAS domain S-box protein [Chloroflexi bacterium]|nr:PAS domain S-box protein [Chloroflexota bacterium]
MIAGKPKKSTTDSPQDGPARSRDLLLALSRVAQSVQQANTADEIYQAVGEQIKSLGHDVIILTLDDERQCLKFSYSTLSRSLIKAGEKLTGLSIKDYSFPILPGGFYGSVIRNGKGQFGRWTSQSIAEALPEAMIPLAGQLARLLKIEQSVVAPLCVAGKMMGTLTVASSLIAEEDIPAIESFAVQVAISLKNVHLSHQMQGELTARRQVEEQLRTSTSTYEGIFNSITEAVYILDGDGIFLKVNSGAEKMYGYHPEYFVGRTPEFLSAPGKNDFSKVAEYIHQAYQGQSLEFEFWGLRKDGSIFPKDVRLTPGIYFGKKVVIAVGRDITERKQAEESLRASEAKNRALLEAIPDMMFVLDDEGVFLDYRVSREQLLYSPPESFLGKNMRDVMPPMMVEAYNAKLDQAVQSGESQLFEYGLDHADGRHHYEAHIVAYQDDNVLCLVRDITERKQAEEAARQAERHFKALIEKAPDGIALVGLDGKTKYASPSARDMFNYGDHADIETRPMEFIHPDDISIVLSEMNDLIQNPEYTPTLEYRVQHRDGSYHWVESTFSNLLSEPGVQAVVINFRDVTERKSAEDALRESESKFHGVVSESADGIILSDEEGRVIEFNSALEEISGRKREAILGQFLWDLQFTLMLKHLRTEERYRQTKEMIQGTLKSGQSSFLHRTVETPFEHADGSVHFIQQRIFSIQTEKGWRLGSVSRDITENKKMEQALRANEESFKSLYNMIRLMADNLPDLIWTKDMEGRFTFVNKAMVEKLLIAQDANEPVGKTFPYFSERQNASHPDNPDWNTFGRACADSDHVIHTTKQAGRFEEFGNVKGEFLFLDVYKAPFLDEQGNMLGTVGIGRDVTREKKLEEERKEAQEALMASEAELRAVFASMQDAVLVIDRDGLYRKVPPTLPGRFQILSPKDVIGKHLGDFFPAEQVEKFLGVIGQVLETRQTLQIEYQLVVNGHSPWFEASISQMNADCTLWVARDISERKQVEAKLNLQSAALEAAANTIIITDRDGLIEWANSSFINLTGFSTNEVIGRNPRDLIKSGMQGPQFYRELWDVILSGRIWHNELINRRKDGSLYFEEMTITPLRNSEGEINHFIAIKQDISNRKQAEDELRRANKSLETAHLELQQSLAQEQVLARTDGLTNIYNRRYFFELAMREFNSTIRYQRPLTIILFDVDGFKMINDTFGHTLGDEVLEHVAYATSKQVRDVDILARYGGDEFIILLPQTDAGQAFQTAERIRQSVMSTYEMEDNSQLMVTLSIGVAEIIHAPPDESVEAVIRRADKALYMAKQNGRNHTIIFPES